MTTKAKKYTFAIICKNKKDQGSEMIRVDHADSNFECPRCGLRLAYIPSSRSLGAHGRDKDTLNHELRQTTELPG